MLRAAERFAATEIRNQENIESVVEKAKGYLPAQVSSEPVNPDWTATLLENCKGISHAELQEVWARLLAAEVAEPGTSSRHTLDIVKALEPAEARLFELIVQTSWSIRGELSWLMFSHEEWGRRQYHQARKCEEYGLDGAQLTKLRLLGLLLPLPSGQYFMQFFSEPVPAMFQGRRYTIAGPRYANGSYRGQNIPRDSLTPWGKELARIVKPVSTPEYLEKELQAIRAAGFTIENAAE